MSSTINDRAGPASDCSSDYLAASKRKRAIFNLARLAWLVMLLVIVGVLTSLYLRGDLTRETLQQLGAAMPTWVFLPAYFVLPLVGFPISIALLASGLKYGLLHAVLIAAFGMAFHTFAAWHLTHGLFRERFESWLAKTRFDMPSIPPRHQIWFTSIFVTVPGLPYAVKLYALALTNLPFQRYFLIVWILHVVNAVPFIGLGIAAARVSAAWLVGFSILALALLLFSNWLKGRYLRSPVKHPLETERQDVPEA